MTTELTHANGNGYSHEQVELIRRTSLDSSTGCFIWNGAKNQNGYGVVERSGVNRYVHRLIAGAQRGQVVRHTCDRPACVNPQHLVVGTQTENMADAVERNRIARGSSLPQSKLTEPQVIAIREEFARGGVSKTFLGKKYGVNSTRIGEIIRRQSWKHI